MTLFKKARILQKLILFILGTLILESCGSNVGRTWENDHIDAATREQIKVLNDKLFKAIVSDNMGDIKNLMSDSLLATNLTDVGKMVSTISSFTKEQSYSILNEYYAVNSFTGTTKAGLINTIPDSIYFLKYPAFNKEMYVSLLTTNLPKNDLLITVIYGKYNNIWKINNIQFGFYAMNKKTAIDYYQLAKARYAKSYLIDAIDYMVLAKNCLYPAGAMFEYKKDKDINAFYDQLMKEAYSKYSLPLTLEKIKTKPKIIQIQPIQPDQDFFPAIFYLSDISLQDTIALKAENDLIKKEVTQIFTGIDRDKKYVYYEAFNEMPNPGRTVDHHEFKVEVAK
jgi:hypothetical protein